MLYNHGSNMVKGVRTDEAHRRFQLRVITHLVSELLMTFLSEFEVVCGVSMLMHFSTPKQLVTCCMQLTHVEFSKFNKYVDLAC